MTTFTAQDIREIAERVARESGYLLLTFPIGLAAFILLVTMVAVSAGLLIVWVGIPLMAATLHIAHGFAELDKLRLRPLGVEISELEPVPSLQGNPARRFLAVWGNSRRWREVAHGILYLPVCVFTWSVTLAWWAMILGGLTSWIYTPIVDRFVPDNRGIMGLLGLPIPEALFHFVIAIFALLTLPFITKAMAAIHIGLARALLEPTKAEMAKRVRELAVARQHQDNAEADALRRLERDIHDGPQQALIRMGMDLAAAERRLAEGDPEQASELLSGARKLNDGIIADLRALSRGIAPPILRERGLEAALTTLAATSVIPVDLSVQVPADLPEPVATGAYYVVAEALANAAKYSQATHVTANVWADESALKVIVSDNGVGGAQVVPGHGLAGLTERVAGLEGDFDVTSIAGTHITVSLPL
ncbi:MAG: sensor domain-containing protein [Propionibacteriaceae bacterium]|jgi:signal transduction histidine kinase|nr:sensor domain-containing protein [Propionibacteriaceae bacterium]